MMLNLLDEGVKHGKIADNDGDEGLADGPLSGLLGTIDTGL